MKHIERHLKSVINISATFIGAKYGNEWGGWCTKSVSGAYGVFVEVHYKWLVEIFLVPLI